MESNHLDLGAKIPAVTWTKYKFPAGISLQEVKVQTDQERLSPKNFSNLLREKARQLRSVVIRPQFDDSQDAVVRQRLQEFIQLSYPKLDSAYLGGGVIDAASMAQVFKACPCLRRVELLGIRYALELRSGCKILEAIEIDKCAIESVQSIVRRSPRLNRFEIKCLIHDNDFRPYMQMLAISKPSLEELDVKLPAVDPEPPFGPLPYGECRKADRHAGGNAIITESDLAAMCELKRIRWLKVRCGAVLSAQNLYQICRSMPRIEVLELDIPTIDRDGMMALTNFRQMKELRLTVHKNFEDVESGLGEYLSTRPHLNSISFGHPFIVQPATLIRAVVKCAELKKIRVYDIRDTNTIKQAVQFVRGLRVFKLFKQSSMRIEVELAFSSIWESNEVRAELVDVNKASGGRSVELVLLNQKGDTADEYNNAGESEVDHVQAGGEETSVSAIVDEQPSAGGASKPDGGCQCCTVL